MTCRYTSLTLTAEHALVEIEAALPLLVCRECRRMQVDELGARCDSCGSGHVVDADKELVGVYGALPTTHDNADNTQILAARALSAVGGLGLAGLLTYLTYSILTALTANPVVIGLVFTLTVLIAAPLLFAYSYTAGERAARRHFETEQVPVPLDKDRTAKFLLLGETSTVVGTARRLMHMIEAPLTAERCLAVAIDLVVGDELVGRTLIANDFIVVDRDDIPTVVSGEIWLQSLLYDHEQPARQVEWTYDGRQILPSQVPGMIAREFTICDGDQVEIRGHLDTELRPGLVGAYRDADAVQVMHGERGHPVLINKRSS